TLQAGGRLPVEIDDAAALDAARADDRLPVEQHQHLPGVDALNLLTSGTRRLRAAPRHDARNLPEDFGHGFLPARFVNAASSDHVHTRVQGLAKFLLP